MTKRYSASVLQDAISMGDCAYEYFEHVEAVLDGMAAILQHVDLTERAKLNRLEKSIKTALCLAQGGGCLVDGENESFRELLRNGGEA